MEVDLPNILKRCSSAPVFTAENGSLSNKIIENVNLPTDKYNEKNLQNSVIPIQNNIIQDKIINSLTEKNNTNISNNFLNSSPFQSNSACSSPVRSREASPAPYNIFAPRARRYSASFAGSIVNNGTVGPRLTPRVSQLRQEECVDANSREVNHEREVHSAMQMSQSWEDLTLVAENWSCKSEDLNNPLQLALPPNNFLTSRQCSSPSPTSRTGMKFNLLSPSPTRRTFATRRSMSPIAMRPSQLGPVKRKFELEDGNWNINYSPPPIKKRFTENSCSPSETFGNNACNITPKLNITKMNSNNMNSPSFICSPTVSSSKDINNGKELNSNEIIMINNNDRKMNGIINSQNETQMEVVKSETNDYENSKSFENESKFTGKPTNLNVVASSSPICSNSDICTTNLLSTGSKESV